MKKLCISLSSTLHTDDWLTPPCLRPRCNWALFKYSTAAAKLRRECTRDAVGSWSLFMSLLKILKNLCVARKVFFLKKTVEVLTTGLPRPALFVTTVQLASFANAVRHNRAAFECTNTLSSGRRMWIKENNNTPLCTLSSSNIATLNHNHANKAQRGLKKECARDAVGTRSIDSPPHPGRGSKGIGKH